MMFAFVNRANCIIIIVTESVIVASKILLPKGGSMTKSSIREYVEAVRAEIPLQGKEKYVLFRASCKSDVGADF